MKLGTDFHNNCKQLCVYPKFLFFKLPNVSNKDVSSIRKRLLHSDINKRNKELQHILKELNISENFLSKQLSTIDFYLLKKSITSRNRKSLQKSLYTQQKKLSSLKRGCSLPIFTDNAIWLSQEESDFRNLSHAFEKIHSSFINNVRSKETKSSDKSASLVSG